MAPTLVRRLTTVVYNLVACGAVGFVAFRWYSLAPIELHAGVLGASAALMTVVSAISAQVFGKLDRLLQDAEKFHVVRMRSIYAYMHGVRTRLVVMLFAAAVAAVMNAGAALFLPKQTTFGADTVRLVVAFGYGAAVGIILFAARVVSAYLQLDGFRLKILQTISDEAARAEALLELRPSAIASFPKKEAAAGR